MSNCFKPEHNETKLIPFSTYIVRLFPARNTGWYRKVISPKGWCQTGAESIQEKTVARNFTYLVLQDVGLNG
jgi:hypothetical protein